MIVVPLMIKGRFYGAVFAGGFLIEGQDAPPSGSALPGAQAFLDPFDREQLYTIGRPYNSNKLDFDTAFTEIPRLSLAELAQLTEILEIGVSEIEAYHIEMTKKERVISQLTKELKDRYRFDRIIGKSAPMKSLYDLLDKICASESTVLVQGENGTGKELVARAIHYNSPRKDKPFVIQNCSAFNDNLLDSELFGHVKGAFTGAIRDKKGLFEIADGGTFFLDEIGDMTPALQVKVLRVLQEGTFMPVGGTEQRKVDVRILAATNKDLRKMVEEGTFREDAPHQRDQSGGALAPETEGGHPHAHRPFPPGAGRPPDEDARRQARAEEDLQEGDAPAARVRLARKHPRAGERDRATGGPCR
jgi:hypothetical protein